MVYEAPLMQKKSFIKTPDQVLASYDYVDVANGLGYVEFHGFTSRPGGTLKYHLGKEVMEPGFTEPSIADHERRKYILANDISGSVTFETTAFNIPRVIQGKVFTNFSFTHISTSANAAFPSVSLYNNSTLLGFASGSYVNAGTPYIKTYNLSFDVASTSIKVGDVLKLTFSGSSLAAAKVMLEHDPLNRDQGAYGAGDVYPGITAAINPTELNCFIPFKIQD